MLFFGHNCRQQFAPWNVVSIYGFSTHCFLGLLHGEGEYAV
jgi:hypothetical protein